MVCSTWSVLGHVRLANCSPSFDTPVRVSYMYPLCYALSVTSVFVRVRNGKEAAVAYS